MRLVLILLMLAGLPASADTPDRTIVVTGQAEVAATPDMAVLRVGVVREARVPDVALDSVAEAVAALFAVLDAAGIAPQDRQTASLSLQPRWERASSGANPRIVGFVASNEVSVRVRDLAVLGGLISDTVGDGANRLSGLSFVVADPAPLEREARRLAVLDAMDKAALYAETANISLGPVMTITDGATSGPMPGPIMAEMAMRSDAMPIAEGEVEIRATVSMVYAIGD